MRKKVAWTRLLMVTLLLLVVRTMREMVVSSVVMGGSVEPKPPEQSDPTRSIMMISSPEELNVRSLMTTNSHRPAGKHSTFLAKFFKSPETSILEVRSNILSI